MTTISLKDGRKVNVIPSDEQNMVITKSDIEMDKRITHAVKAAIDRAKVCKRPIARYDEETKRAYVEYPNGEKKYVE